MTEMKIIYTHTDESPALATYSFLPIVQSFLKTACIHVETKDISLAGRIIALFPENLTPEQRQTDELAVMGQLTQDPNANMIKLPNISASIPQLKNAITELQQHGYNIPNYPEEPKDATEAEIQSRYAKVLGSAVNPVLREGNSDRRVALAVKKYAKQHPHRLEEWSRDSKTHVSHMSELDFYGSEQSKIQSSAGTVRIVLETKTGETITLKDAVPLQDQEVFDCSVLNKKALCAFFENQIHECQEQGLLLSLHLKATMMKISDPVIFGHAVKAYYADVFQQHQAIFDELGVNPNNGIGDVYAKIQQLPEEQRQKIEQDLNATQQQRPPLAMVDSDNGITNLHVPSDVIIDASMPAAIKSSGKMWGPDGKLHDTKMMIPDRCYAGIYQAVIDFCKRHGAFDVTTMGNVANVGLMAQKAEEYGSHDKTFIIPTDGTVNVIDEQGQTLLSTPVEAEDIWRMCQTKDRPIQDWVKLAVSRARATANPAVFWLDPKRAHDANLINKVQQYLKDHDTTGLTIKIMSPVDAMNFTLERVKNGEDTISVTGNVLRDYLTDLFPILELGTSAKMLSIVPLLAGGGLYETGAGGSAPKHVQQFIKQGHLRWSSLGEFLALAVSIEELAEKHNNTKARVLATALHQANEQFLAENKAPLRGVGERDSRGSHFYLAMYWAQALAAQTEDTELKALFTPIANKMTQQEEAIIHELNSAQGAAMDLGGYYHPDPNLMEQAMRPSALFNELLTTLSNTAEHPVS